MGSGASKQPKRGLIARHRAFALEYLISLNATDAYRKVYPQSKNPDVDGPRLLGTPGVKAFVAERVAKREARLELRAERLDEELARVALADIGQAFGPDGGLLPLTEMPEDVRRALAGVEVEELWEGRGDERAQVGELKKIRLLPKVEALTLAYRRLGLLKDKLEVDVRTHADLVAEAMKRAVERRAVSAAEEQLGGIQ
jgi:phage terminase small subunit